MRTWKTKDGRELAPQEMSDKHIESTIYFIRRNAHVYKARNIAPLMSECPMDVFEEIDSISCRNFVCDDLNIYSDMLDEAALRDIPIDDERGWRDDKESETLCNMLIVKAISARS